MNSKTETGIKFDCFPYGIQITYGKLIDTVTPLFSTIEEWEKSTKEKMSMEWEDAYHAFIKQMNDADDLVWDIMGIFDAQNTAMVIKEGYREYQNANGFIKMFMKKPDFDAGIEEITPRSKKRAIREYKSSLLTELSVLATPQHAGLQKGHFNNNRLIEVMTKHIFPILENDWIHKWWFIEDIQETVLTPLQKMLNDYKTFNTAEDDICIIGDQILNIINWCEFNIDGIKNDENFGWHRH